MASEMSAPPVLSTPDNHILSETEPVVMVEPSLRLSDEQVMIRYEIERTIKEIKRNRWQRVALQFPDHMLSDSARVYHLLARGLRRYRNSADHDENVGFNEKQEPTGEILETTSQELDVSGGNETNLEQKLEKLNVADENATPVKLTILGDTSYGSCCVDEIAAEHVDADAVVHYGRSCLSPTARLPVVYVFTSRELDLDAVCASFEDIFKEKNDRVIVTADTSYATHVKLVVDRLRQKGYDNIFASARVHDPSSLVPNRTVPESVTKDPAQLSGWDLFHISDPPTSLLLTLSSRMKSVHIYPTKSEGSEKPTPHRANTSIILRRRYALITSLGTVSTWGILINTLSVKNYLHIVDHVKKQIANAGKKSYLFVVGKLNAAKIANFAEIGGWIVIGCWESSLVDSKDFYSPIITPFELDLVLAGDENRIWTGQWRSDFQGLLDQARDMELKDQEEKEPRMPGAFIDDDQLEEEELQDLDSDEESAAPEYDLRTGRYVSHTRPMGNYKSVRENQSSSGNHRSSTAVIKRSNGELLAVKGVASPAAEFLSQKRTWKGLGSDFEIKYEEDGDEQGALIEEGRTGIASGYTVADSAPS